MRAIAALNHAGLDVKALREAEVTLDGLPLCRGQPGKLALAVDAHRHAAGMQVVGDAARAAQQHRGGRFRRQVDQDALATRLWLPGLPGTASLQRLRRLADGEFAQGHQLRLLKNLLRLALGPLRRIDCAALQTVEQRARRDVHHHHFVRLLEDPVRHRLPNPQPRDLPDLVGEARQVMHIHRRKNVDSGIEQHLHVFPAFRARRAGRIGVRQLIHHAGLRPAAQDASNVHLLRRSAAARHSRRRNRFQALGPADDVRPPARRQEPDDDIHSARLQRARVLQHLIRLAHARARTRNRS